jgi:hypothetical protein
MTDKTIFKLSKPIKAHGQELSELQLREPTGDDVEKLGFPYVVTPKSNGETTIEIRAHLIYQYISRLAGIPKESAKQVSLGDLSLLSGLVISFFGESTQEQETFNETEANS